MYKYTILPPSKICIFIVNPTLLYTLKLSLLCCSGEACVALRPMLAVVLLLVGPPIPDRSWVMTRQRGAPWSSKLGVGCGTNNPNP